MLDSRCRTAIIGALLADALGVPHEFKPGLAIPPASQLVLVMPPSYPKSHPGVPYGVWSDDGAQLLCVLESMQTGRPLKELLLAWLKEGRHQANALVFDCGGQTRRALLDEPSHASSRVAEGNGGLMRVLPAALSPWIQGLNEVQASELAASQCAVTHPGPLSQATCRVYARMVQLAENAVTDWRACARSALSWVASQSPDQQEPITQLAQALDSRLPNGGGYVVDTFVSMVWALQQGNGQYLPSVRAAISLGNDTDTVACVTGGLAAWANGMTPEAMDWFRQLDVPSESAGLLSEE